MRWKSPATAEDRKRVLSYAAFGVSDDEIAQIIGTSEATLKRHFSEELTQGRLQSKAKIGEKLYHIAIGYEYQEEEVDERGNTKVVTKRNPPNLTALIFLAKVRLGWKETQVVENVHKKSKTVLYLPDNGTSDFSGEYGDDPNRKEPS